jgi:hypothetical protein
LSKKYASLSTEIISTLREDPGQMVKEQLVGYIGKEADVEERYKLFLARAEPRWREHPSLPFNANIQPPPPSSGLTTWGESSALSGGDHPRYVKRTLFPSA